MTDFIASQCTYLDHAFRPEAEIVAQATRVLAGVDYDTLVGTGLSGALVVPLLGRALSKRWLLVRKPGENAHSEKFAEGQLGRRWVFVDDLISTGETQLRVRGVIADIATERHFATEYVGDYLYIDEGRFDPASHT